MKNKSLILQVILILAVGFLYYLHFSGNNSGGGLPANTKPSSIVFVNSDSLLNSFEYFKQTKSRAEENRGKLEAELNAKAQELQGEVNAYQQKAPTMTPEQRQKTEEKLVAKQQQLMQNKEEMVGQLTQQEQKMNEELYSKIATYLKKYAAGGTYDFVLGYSKGGGVLYANDSLDITSTVIKGLNQEYKK